MGCVVGSLGIDQVTAHDALRQNRNSEDPRRGTILIEYPLPSSDSNHNLACIPFLHQTTITILPGDGTQVWVAGSKRRRLCSHSRATCCLSCQIPILGASRWSTLHHTCESVDAQVSRYFIRTGNVSNGIAGADLVPTTLYNAIGALIEEYTINR